MANALRRVVKNYTGKIDKESGALNSVPNFLIDRTVFMSWNAMLQLMADIVLEIVLLTGLLPFYLPFRLEFFLLTIISAVVAYLTVKAMRDGALDLTRGTLVTGFFVESSLVIGDIYLLFTTEQYLLETMMVRLPFVFLTLLNVWVILSFLWLHLNVSRHRPPLGY